MKILFLGDSKSYNTISWLSDLKNEIKSIDIEIISLANDGLNKNFLSKILILFSFLQKTKQTIKTFDPDILIAYRTTSYGFLGSLTGFHPFVVAQQGQSDLSLKKGFKRFILSKLRKLCLKKADLIHVWTLHQKKSVLKNNIPEQKILLKPRGINLDIFSFNGSRDLKENHIIITRSLYPEYNHLKLIRVIENLISINCNFKLSIVGKGPQKDNIIKIINDLKLNDNIIMHGSLSQVEVSNLLKKSKIYVSLNMIEGLSASLIEAMACGCVPIVADIPGNSIINNKLNGFRVDVNDVKEISCIMNEILIEDEKRLKIIAENKKIVNEQFDSKKNLKIFTDNYKNLIDNYRNA